MCVCVCVREATVRRTLREQLDWVVSTPLYCQTIREMNKIKRVEFSRRVLSDNDSFSNIIFSDESNIELTWHKRTCRRKKGQRKFKPKPKHPLKIHVWAGTSCRRATSICVFTGIMDSKVYIKILEHHLLPFLHDVYPANHCFMQDNDPKRCSRMTKRFLQEKGISWWPTPPESPYLNPIEKVWNELKRFFEPVKPFTKEELVQGILEFWRLRMTPKKCRRYISHLIVVMPKVLVANGGPTGE